MVPLAAAVSRQCDRAKEFRISKPFTNPFVNRQSKIVNQKNTPSGTGADCFPRARPEEIFEAIHQLRTRQRAGSECLRICTRALNSDPNKAARRVTSTPRPTVIKTDSREHFIEPDFPRAPQGSCRSLREMRTHSSQNPRRPETDCHNCLLYGKPDE